MKTKVQITISNSKAKVIVLENNSWYDSATVAAYFETVLEEAFRKCDFKVSYKVFEQSFTCNKLEELIG